MSQERGARRARRGDGRARRRLRVLRRAVRGEAARRRTPQLREFNGDKLFVVFDPEEGALGARGRLHAGPRARADGARRRGRDRRRRGRDRGRARARRDGGRAPRQAAAHAGARRRSTARAEIVDSMAARVRRTSRRSTRCSAPPAEAAAAADDDELGIVRASTVRRRIVVHGRVQGVFFRDTTRRRADELGVAGWASNEPTGRAGRRRGLGGCRRPARRLRPRGAAARDVSSVDVGRGPEVVGRTRCGCRCRGQSAPADAAACPDGVAAPRASWRPLSRRRCGSRVPAKRPRLERAVDASPPRRANDDHALQAASRASRWRRTSSTSIARGLVEREAADAGAEGDERERAGAELVGRRERRRGRAADDVGARSGRRAPSSPRG